MSIIVSPSILSADFAEFGKAVDEIEASGAKWIHMDVMDGCFVQNLTFGSPLVRALRSRTKTFFDVHLMIVQPERHIKAFADAGADGITFHYETCENPKKLLADIRSLGCKCGISIKPGTPVSVLEEVLPYTDIVLVMTVEPGYGGQKIITECLAKVKELAEMRKKSGLDFFISVDGGIDRETAPDAIKAGSDILVMGSAFFSDSDKKALVEFLENKGNLKI